MGAIKKCAWEWDRRSRLLFIIQLLLWKAPERLKWNEMKWRGLLIWQRTGIQIKLVHKKKKEHEVQPHHDAHEWHKTLVRQMVSHRDVIDALLNLQTSTNLDFFMHSMDSIDCRNSETVMLIFYSEHISFVLMKKKLLPGYFAQKCKHLIQVYAIQYCCRTLLQKKNTWKRICTRDTELRNHKH